MPAPAYLDQEELLSDVESLVQYSEQSLNKLFDPIPANIQKILEKYLDIYAAIAGSKTFRDNAVEWINANSGAVPPKP